MYQLIMIIHVLAAACIIALVLVQQGKGATVGAAFGSGASQTVFGSRGSGSFLLKVTIGFAMVFFLTSIALNHIATAAMKPEAAATLPILPTAPIEQPQSQSTNNNNAPISVTPNSIPSSPTH